MAMTLGKALRLVPRAAGAARGGAVAGTSLAFTGAGGKTTTMFALARQLPVPSLVTTTTHLGAWQTDLGDRHIVATCIGDLEGLGDQKISVITGPEGADERLSAVSAEVLEHLRSVSLSRGWHLLIEADGARQKPLKAPGADEPRVPSFVENVVVVAGMEGLNSLLAGESVHRPEVFARLSGMEANSSVGPEAIARVLVSSQGGLKGIPKRARRIALLNQADTSEQQAQALRLADAVAGSYDSVIIASARAEIVHAAREPVAGIVLAAGGATRYGGAKQLLPWKGQPLLRTAVEAALEAELSNVVVVTGAYAEEVEAAVGELNVTVARNEAWQEGQASSIKRGLDACPPGIGSAVFLLADQPFVSAALVRSLCDAHASEAPAIAVPLIGGHRRGNPVLFDRETFADLRGLLGDEGGRAIFSKHRVYYVPWNDERIIQDIDTEGDYCALLEDEQQ